MSGQPPQMPDQTGEDEDVPLVVLETYRHFTQALNPCIAGSQVIRAKCGHLALVSPPGQLFLSQHPEACTSCMDCRAKDLGPHDVKLYTVPGAVESVDATFTNDAARQSFHRWLERKGVTEYGK